MTRGSITAIARRHKLGPLVDALFEEYAERMAICTVEGGLSEVDADAVAMADCEIYAAELSTAASTPHSSPRERLQAAP